MSNKLQHTKLRYVAYYRKSTESDERQVQSIPDQREWALKAASSLQMRLEEQYEESMSARKPGRPQFDAVLASISQGKANALLAYDASRIARNAMDGARIIELLDSGQLHQIVTATSTFKNTSTDKFMLAFFFAESKRYTDNLSELVHRGLASKLAKGIYPGKAKLGYLNHPKTHEIIPDPVRFPLIKRMFELYATGQYSMLALAKVMYGHGLKGYYETLIPKASMSGILVDPFYYGAILWKGELYRGCHEPVVSKALWDKVQRVFAQRGRAQAHYKREFPFLGLIRCGECGASITAETHVRTQQNGNHHVWRYYRCTKKGGTLKCSQPFMREEDLLARMWERLKTIALPESEEWVFPMLRQLDDWEAEAVTNENAPALKLEIEIAGIAAKLRRLNDLHVDGEIDRAEYAARKRKLVNAKIALETQFGKIARQGVMYWLEPLRELINAVRESNLPAAGGDLLELRDFVAEVGSNLILNSRKVLWDWIPPYALLAERALCSDWSG
ncbi:MAG: recombinase family protein [Patescibacteria group bacterium]